MCSVREGCEFELNSTAQRGDDESESIIEQKYTSYSQTNADRRQMDRFCFILSVSLTQ